MSALFWKSFLGSVQFGALKESSRDNRPGRRFSESGIMLKLPKRGCNRSGSGFDPLGVVVVVMKQEIP